MRFLKFFHAFFKMICGIIVLIIYFSTALAMLVIPMNNYKRKKIFSAIYGALSSVFIKILGIKLIFKNSSNYFDNKKTWYIMSNHVSFIDILVIVTKFKTLFITSLEMRARPVLGQLTVMAGCLFVDRKKITTLKSEIPQVKEAFKHSANVCLFPESTCSNGINLLPFKSALMGAVEETDAQILPICVMYRKIDGRNFTTDDFRRIGYFGGMKFANQFKKILFLTSLVVEIEALQPFSPNSMDRKEICAEVFREISTRHNLYLDEIKQKSN